MTEPLTGIPKAWTTLIAKTRATPPGSLNLTTEDATRPELLWAGRTIRVALAGVASEGLLGWLRRRAAE
jgi:hypothetical protein